MIVSDRFADTCQRTGWQTLRDLGFRGRYEANVVAVWHGGRSVRTDVANLALQDGDALLIHAGPRRDMLMRIGAS